MKIKTALSNLHQNGDRSIDRSITEREREYNRGLIYCKFSQLKPTIKLLYILYINKKNRGNTAHCKLKHNVQFSKSSIEYTISKK